jgi:hypothetical protein
MLAAFMASCGNWWAVAAAISALCGISMMKDALDS